MSIQYGNPPLVELIAELRWGPSLPTAQPNKMTTVAVTLPRAQDDEVFMNFGMLVAQKGYGRLERLAPAGVPLPPQFIACRFRPTDPNQQSPLFQIGKGIFTANAVPPNYGSWESFCPIVRNGIEMLIDSHQRAGEPPPDINQALVRYIDVFNDELTGGRSVSDFMSEVLGVQVTLPKAITSLAKIKIEPLIQFSVPVELGLLSMTIGGGTRGTDVLPLLDTSLLIQRPIGADVDEAIKALSDGRGVIHDLFRALTASIHETMRPLA